MTSSFATSFFPDRPGVDYNAAVAAASVADDSRIAWTPSRKQACDACRRRKRKCDGARPYCDYCRKHKLGCFYAPSKNTLLSGSANVFGPGLSHDPASSRSGSTFDGEPTNRDGVSRPTSKATTLWDFRTGAALPSPGLSNIALDDLFSSRMYGLPMDQGANSDQLADNTFQSHAESSTLARTLLSSTTSTDTIGNGLIKRLSDHPTDLQSPPDKIPRTRMTPENPLQLSSRQATRDSSVSDSDSAPLRDFPLEPALLQELIDVFFERHHNLLPCIHRARFADRLAKGRASLDSSPLIWAVLAVAASANPSLRLRTLQSSWLANAISVFERNVLSGLYPTQTLQSAVWIVYLLYTSADMKKAWFTLGTACRLANILGFDRMDYAKRNCFLLVGPNPRDRIEAEEQRKTFWCLYFLETFISSLASFPRSINERQLHINFPVDDEVFQAATTESDLPQPTLTPFPAEPGLLAASAALCGLESKISITHIFRATVLLSRVTSIVNDLHTPRRSMEFIGELAQMKKVVQSYTDAAAHCLDGSRIGSDHTLILELWLMVILCNCSILLHHPYITDWSPDGTAPQNPAEESASLPFCVLLARDMVKDMRRSANKSIESCMNPFIVPSCLVLNRLLMICWRDQQLPSDHEDIEFILEIVDRIEQKWPSLAKKYRQGIMQNMKYSKKGLMQLWMETGSYHSVQCI